MVQRLSHEETVNKNSFLLRNVFLAVFRIGNNLAHTAFGDVGMKKSVALILAIVVAPLLAWICQLVAVSLASPSADANLAAYSLLVQAARANDIMTAKNFATSF
jgi:hypothetical protein